MSGHDGTVVTLVGVSDLDRSMGVYVILIGLLVTLTYKSDRTMSDLDLPVATGLTRRLASLIGP